MISASTDMTFKKSLLTQARIIHALVMREIITRYGRHNIGFLWLILEPMLFTLGVLTLWVVSGHSVKSGVSIVAFIVTGYSSILLWRNAVGRCCNAIEPNFALLHHRNVHVIDFFFARLILEVAGGTLSFAILTMVFSWLGLCKPPSDLNLVMMGWILLAWFSSGAGLIVGVMSNQSEVFDRVWHTVMYILVPLSGAFFMVDWLPQSAQKYAVLVPMVSATEMIRHGFLGELVKTYEDPLYLLKWNVVLTLVGLIMVRNIQRKIEAP